MSIFDEMAHKYDSADRIEQANIITKELVTYLADCKNKTAIELGCGTGLIGLELAGYFESISLIDNSQNMINIVDEKIATHKITNAKTIWLNIETEPVHHIKSDYIILPRILLHVPDYQIFLKKALSMLRDTGVLLIVDFDKNHNIKTDKIHNGFEQKALSGFLQLIGLKNISSHTFHKGENILMNKEASMFIMLAEK